MFQFLYRLRLILPLIFLSGYLHSSGFLRTEGRTIADETGNPVLLRGFGLGGWLVQEDFVAIKSTHGLQMNTHHYLQ